MKDHSVSGKSAGARQVETLADSARSLAERGDLEQAERVYLKILTFAPYHLPSLNFLAAQALRRGANADAVGHLERALRAAPQRGAAHQNLALAYKALGQKERALTALERASELEPALRTAHLHRGALLEELGRKDEAVAAYWRAWRLFPPPTLLANPSIAPPHLRALCLHAAERLRCEQLALLESALDPLWQIHGRSALARVEQAAATYVGAESTCFNHPLQRPCFMTLPGIEPRTFFERAEFPWLRKIESATNTIDGELGTLLNGEAEALAPYVQEPVDDTPPDWRTLNRSKRWSSFHFIKGGTTDFDHARRCPETARALSALPLPTIPGHAPEAFFSILQPGTQIPPHHGLGNYKLVVHLPLLIPGDCGLRVGAETRGWRRGECLVFDDSFEHEAWNRSDTLRAVLIFDIWNPLVNEVEREGITALVGAITLFKERYCQTP